jgi:hypothetical protein
VAAAPVHVQPRRDDTLFPYLPSVEGMQRSNRAIYELLGEPVREAFVALNLRRQQP